MLHPAEFGFGREERALAQRISKDHSFGGYACHRCLLAWPGCTTLGGVPKVPPLFGKVVLARMTSPRTSYLRPLVALVAF